MTQKSTKTPQNASKSRQPQAEIKLALGTNLMRIIERQTSWVTTEISAWKAALVLARNKEKPRRDRLQQLYEAVIADGHLTSAIEKRVMRVSGQAFRIVDKKGLESPDLIEIFEKSWFLTFMEEALTVQSHGPCLFVFDPPQKRGEVPKIRLVPRAHYVPEELAIIEDLGADDKLIRLDQPMHEPWCMHLGNANSLGYLWKAIPYITFKNAANTAWAEYCDLFGQPIRKATVPPNMTSEQLHQVDNQLEKMGRSAYIRLPNGVEFDLHSPSGRSGIEVFQKRLEFCNNDLSKLVEGQTMTSDEGSSKAQGEVHQETANLYTFRDRVWFQGVVNEQLLPKLKFHGFNTDGYRFLWADEQEIEFSNQLEADKWLHEHYDIDDSYYAEKYGVPIRGRKLPPAPAPAPVPAPAPKKDSAALLGILGKVYAKGCTHCQASAIKAEGPDMDNLRSILEKISRQIHSGDLPDGVVPPERLLETGSLYESALTESFGSGFDWNSPDQAALEFLKQGSWQFAGARTDSEAQLIRDLLIGEDGQKRSYSEFRQKVLDLNESYFEPWLQTEYNHAQMSATAASQWLQVNADKEEFPNLRYETIGDERVRETHELLNGVTRPVDDPFWDTAFPPNGWRCRCDVSQEDADASLTPPADAQAAATLAVKDARFKTNVGKTLATFPEVHPYYDKATPHADYRTFGLKTSASSPKVTVTPVNNLKLGMWFEKLPETSSGARQTYIAGRSVSLPEMVINALKATNQVGAAAPIIDRLEPSETWMARDGNSLLVTLLWFMDGKVARTLLAVSKAAITVADISLLEPGVADLSRNGTLTQLADE